MTTVTSQLKAQAIVGFFCALALCECANAQSTLALSNLDTGVSRTEPIASDAWIAAEFRIGDNFDGYFLNSVQLGIDSVTGSPSDLSVAVYEAFSVNSSPSVKLGDLSASGSNSNGSYNFDAEDITLGRGYYSIVVTAGTDTSVGSYLWNVSTSSDMFVAEDGGNMEGAYLVSENGLDWRVRGRTRMQYAIYATAIPEPSTLALFGCGALFAAIRLRRAKRTRAE